MKISKIKLHSYLHFKPGLEIDFTYPKGHPKAGRPLDKVCFLGQSATGKTTLLNLIKCCVSPSSDFNPGGMDKSALTKGGVELFLNIDHKSISKISVGEFSFQYYDNADPLHPKLIDYKPFEETIDHLIQRECKPLLINFPFCVVVPDDTQKLRATFDASAGEIAPVTFNPDRQVWDFNHTTINCIWDIVFGQVQHYLTEHKAHQVKSFTQITSNPQEAQTIVEGFKAWEKLHPNPIKELADKCLSKILEYFHLEIETNVDKYQSELPTAHGRMHIIIKSKATGHEVPYEYLSTGTKQIMLTAIPLFYLKPSNCIILFDQPETSLYPNIQRMVPDVYLDSAPKSNQFFFATHSPVIASSFDPWEVVELKFNSDGIIEQNLYFQGERHVDNYHIRPKLLRWDSSYKKLFGLDVEGNEERTEKLMELASLEKEIQNTTSPSRKREIFDKYKTLAAELDWQIHIK